MSDQYISSVIEPDLRIRSSKVRNNKDDHPHQIDPVDKSISNSPDIKQNIEANHRERSLFGGEQMSVEFGFNTELVNAQSSAVSTNSKKPKSSAPEEPVKSPNVNANSIITKFEDSQAEKIQKLDSKEIENNEQEMRRRRQRVMSAEAPKRSITPMAITRVGEWLIGKTIGSGSTGKVKLATHRISGEKVALKIIPRTGIKKQQGRETTASRERRIYREAALLNLLHDNHIVHLKDFLVTKDHFCMFLEYVEGVQLLDYIVSNGRLDESKAKSFMRQILKAVDYCHAHAIVHRDLKIENILVDKSGQIKLLDFGLSNLWAPDAQLDTYCGSLYFAAPELLHGTPYCGPEVDVWSLGIILYVLVVGRVPFDDRSLPALHEKIKKARLNIPDHVSPQCRDLLMRMICREKSERATMDDVIFHPWINEGYSSVPAYLHPDRDPIHFINEQALSLIIHLFAVEVIAGGEEEIRRVMQQALVDWASVYRHPVISLYHLALDLVTSTELNETNQSESMKENFWLSKQNGLSDGHWSSSPSRVSSMIRSDNTMVYEPRSKSATSGSTPVCTKIITPEHQNFQSFIQNDVSFSTPRSSSLDLGRMSLDQKPNTLNSANDKNNQTNRKSNVFDSDNQGINDPLTCSMEPKSPATSKKAREWILPGTVRSPILLREDNVLANKDEGKQTNQRVFRESASVDEIGDKKRSQGWCHNGCLDKSHLADRRRSFGDGGGGNKQDEYLGIKTIYLKGFFSIQMTSSRPAMAIRNEIHHYLIRHGFRFEDNKSHFLVEHRPSLVDLPARRSSDDKSNQNRRNAIKNNPQTEESSSSNFLRPRSASLPTSPRISAPINKISLVDDTGKEFDDGRIIFEIQIVKLALLGGIYGIQLRRLQGELCHYRSLTAQILSSLTL